MADNKKISGSIRNKLIFTFIPVIILAIIIISTYAAWSTSISLEDRLKSERVILLNSLADNIVSFLDGLEEDVIFLSNSQTLAQYLSAQADELDKATLVERRVAMERDFFAFAQARKVYDQVRFLDITGQEIVRINTTVGGVSTIVAVDKLQNKADRYYFADTVILSPGELMVSPLDLNIEQGKIEILADGSYKPVIRFGTPVIFNGKVVGVIVTNIMAENFLQLLNVQDAITYLVDKDGYYLYNPDESKRWGRDLKTEIRLFSDYSQEVGQTLLANESGVLISGDNFFTHRPVKLPNSDTIWYLGEIQSQSVIFKPVSNFIYTTVFVAIVILFLSTVIVIIISQTITSPIIQLDKAAQHVASGDFDIVIEQNSQDEIGSLARSFDIMTHQIQSSIANLEERVADRTHIVETVAVVGEYLVTILDFDKLLSELVNQIKIKFGYYHVHIYMLDHEHEKLVVAEGTGEAGAKMKLQGHNISLNNMSSLVARAARTGDIVMENNVHKAKTWLPNPLLPDTYSEISVPIVLDGQVVGVLDVQDNKPDTMDEGVINLLRSLNNYIVVAIRNARLFAEIEADLLKSRATLEEQMKHTWQDNEGKIEQYYYTQPDISALDIATINKARQLALSQSSTAIVTLADNSIPQELSEQEMKKGEESIISPIIFSSKTIGSLHLHPADNSKSWTEDDLAIVEAVAYQLAQSAERVRLFNEVTEQANQEHAIREITNKLRDASSLEQLTTIAAQELGDYFSADYTKLELGFEDGAKAELDDNKQNGQEA